MYLLLLDEATAEFDEEEDDDDMGTHIAPLKCVTVVLFVVGFITIDVFVGGAPQFQESPEEEEEETIRSLGICLLINVDTTGDDGEHPLPPALSTSFQSIGVGSKGAPLAALYFNTLGGMITETCNVY